LRIKLQNGLWTPCPAGAENRAITEACGNAQTGSELNSRARQRLGRRLEMIDMSRPPERLHSQCAVILAPFVAIGAAFVAVAYLLDRLF